MSTSYKRFWHILTGEYPPQPGGVSDYTRLVAEGLALCGDEVHVWAPLGDLPPSSTAYTAGGVRVHRIPDHFGWRGLRLLEAHLRQAGSGRILVQYVPHAFGWHGMNVLFSRWVRRMARAGAAVDVMFHEVAYPLARGQPMKHNAMAIINRRMALWLCDCADRIFVSIPAWETFLNKLGVRHSMSWSPIPSNVSRSPEPQAVAAIRSGFGNGTLIGHFGTYGQGISPAVRECVTLLSTPDPSRKFLMLGRGGEEFLKRLAIDVPSLAGRMHAPGTLDAQPLSEHLAACDLMIQPYGDGVSTRRSSVMASLALGLPIATSIGPLTEPIWKESGCVALALTPDAKHLAATAETILRDPKKRAALGARARALYLQKFDVIHTIQLLRS